MWPGKNSATAGVGNIAEHLPVVQRVRRRLQYCHESRPISEVGINLELNPVEIAVWADKIGSDGIPVPCSAPTHRLQPYVSTGSRGRSGRDQECSDAEQADLLVSVIPRQPERGSV